MKNQKIVLYTLLIVVTLTASHLHAATTDLTLKHREWKLIAVPNPIPFAINTPMKMFGAQIAAANPQAEYGLQNNWVMLSYDSELPGYVEADPNAEFEPGEGYWAIQVVSGPGTSITVEVVNRYNLGDTGPGGGVVFHVDPDSEGTSGLEAAPEDQSEGIVWCSQLTDIALIENVIEGGIDPNTGVSNTEAIISDCGTESAAGVADSYVWPKGQTDGYLPNVNELVQLITMDQNLSFIVRPADDLEVVAYWSSSEVLALRQFAWAHRIGNTTLGVPADRIVTFKTSDSIRVRAIRAFQ